MLGTDERRLRRMDEYVASLPPRSLPPRRRVAGGGAIEGNAADDALMVDQGTPKFVDIKNIEAYYRALWTGSTAYTW